MSLSAIEKKIAGLSAEMAEAVAHEDFKAAARLRDEIAGLKGESQGGISVGKPPPGQMGLGTHIPVAAPKSGWTPPKKPDPMTAGHKKRGQLRG